MTAVNLGPTFRSMSTTLIAHLRRIERQTQRNVAADNIDGPRNGRLTNVTDFYRPLELVRRGLS